LSICNLADLGYRGPKFTWTNKRSPGEFIKARLDRALANPGCASRYLDVLVEVLVARSSDHKPLWICFDYSRFNRRRNRSFKYKACWNLDDESKEIVRTAWDTDDAIEDTMEDVILKLENCK